MSLSLASQWASCGTVAVAKPWCLHHPHHLLDSCRSGLMMAHSGHAVPGVPVCENDGSQLVATHLAAPRLMAAKEVFDRAVRVFVSPTMAWRQCFRPDNPP